MKPISEEDKIRNKLLTIFGKDFVKEFSAEYDKIHKIRLSNKDSYDFLISVKEIYPEDSAKIIAAVLYGISIGGMIGCKR